MKKVLLTTTALAGATAVMAAAPAYAADPINIGVRGYFNFGYIFQDADNGAGEPAQFDHTSAFRQESEIQFRGETTLDNGITVGVRIELEGETGSDQIDNSFAYFETQFGTLFVGGADPVADSYSPGAPQVARDHGVDDADAPYAEPGTGFAADSFGDVSAGPGTSTSGDAALIAYETPSFAGFKAAVSYAPQVDVAQSNTSFPDFGDDEVENQIEFGVEYSGEFSGVGVTLVGIYTTGDYAQNYSAAGAAGDQLDERTGYNFGGEIEFAGFTVGGEYGLVEVETVNGNTANDTEATFWNIGAVYTFGAYSVGAAYEQNEVQFDTANAPDDTHDIWTVQAGYDLGGGVELAAGVVFFELENGDLEATGAADGSNEGYYGFLETQINF